MLFGSIVIFQFQHDILRLTQVHLGEVQLRCAHKVILEAPIIVEDLSKRPRSFASRKKEQETDKNPDNYLDTFWDELKSKQKEHCYVQ